MNGKIHEIDWKQVESVLANVARPGRYIGNELHAIKKDWKQVDVTFALAFPDLYEIGMSNVGLGILYHILNKAAWIAAERVYSPWIDFEAKLREMDIPLFSMETRTPIRRFDVLGITLQTELQYTNVLNLIDLSGIPLRSRERQARDPIVVAGGPCTFNIEPMAEFFDAVVLGDGEEVILELAATIRTSKRERWNRPKTLKALAGIEGIYVPSFYEINSNAQGRFQKIHPVRDDIPKTIKARILDRLSSDNYPSHPLVPMIEVTHDRFSMEIMRGCTRGCRFCSAGMTYRPVRERPVNDLIKHAKEVIANTGFDEISLVSLSTSDYGPLPRLLGSIQDTFQHKAVSLSFPSLRPDTFTPDIADMAQGLRRSGLTLAPEAGTQRLRDVINKNNCEEDLLCAVETAFQRGWKHVKLYFMIGLPTETREDLQGIVDLIGKVVKVGKRFGRREIRVSISPFSPKAHTPFQWEAQDTIEILEKKIQFLRKKIVWPQVILNWRDPHVSFLEAILGRSDRGMGEVIFHAWRKGAKFDAWTDQFKYNVWIQAFKETDLCSDDYIASKSLEDSLPWDHLYKGISKSFLLREREKAYAENTSPDCRVSGCQQCGLMTLQNCNDQNRASHSKRSLIASKRRTGSGGRNISRIQGPEIRSKVRIGFTKGDEVRFTSHLDLIRIFTRAITRANIPLAFSQGFHAHAKIATGPPLPLGFTSHTEYLDFEVIGQPHRHLERVLTAHLPSGFEIFGTRILWSKVPSLNRSITLATYLVSWKGLDGLEDMGHQIEVFMKKNSYKVVRKRKDTVKDVDIRSYVLDIDQKNGGLNVALRLTEQGTARIEEVVKALVPSYESYPETLRVVRTGLFIEKQGVRVDPLDIEGER